jgi:hypothetical protein
LSALEVVEVCLLPTPYTKKRHKYFFFEASFADKKSVLISFVRSQDFLSQYYPCRGVRSKIECAESG